jgi:ParB-like chromosome segregation protein Spo0J
MGMAGALEVDPMSAASPELDASDATALRDSIATLGQLVPIVVWRGKVIDGRKRLAACDALGIAPKSIAIPDVATATDYAAALNLLRTHYTTGQRAMYAAALVNAPHGNVDRSANPQIVTAKQAGNMVGLHESRVQEAKRIRRDGAPEIAKAVERGDISLDAGKRIVTMHPKEKQAAVVARAIEVKGNAKIMPTGTIRPRTNIAAPVKPAPQVVSRFIRGLADTAELLKPYLDRVDACPAEHRARWMGELDDVIAILRRFRRRLQTEGKP